MTTTQLLIISLPLIIIFLAILLRGLHPDQFPYKKKEFLMNIPERKFFEELKRIIPENYAVFPQIVLSSIVNVSRSRASFWTFFNKINRKTIDFVIFELPYYKPVLAIEYDGKSHEQTQRKERDTFVTKVLETAEIKSIHIKHQPVIDFERLKNQINNCLITPLVNTNDRQ